MTQETMMEQDDFQEWMSNQYDDGSITLVQGDEREFREFVGWDETYVKKIKEDFLAPYDKYQAALGYIWRNEPFYMYMLKQCDIKWDEKIVPTMGVRFYGNNFQLIINKKYVDSITLSQCIGDIKHEMLHCMLKHLDRGKNYNKHAFNIVADMAIDQFIRDNKHLKDYRGIYPDDKDFKWGPMQTAEKYFHNLILSSRKFIPCKECDGDAIVKANGKELLNVLVFSLKHRNNENYKKCPKCKGLGSQPKNNDGSHGFYFAPSGKKIQGCKHYDVHISWSQSENNGGEESISQNMDSRIRQMIANAYENSKHHKDILGAGNLPGNLKKFIKNIVNAEISWEQQLKMFIHRSSTPIVVQTRHRPNRRWKWLYPGTRSDYTLKIVIALDTSGSMGRSEIEKAFNEINYIVSKLNNEIYIMEVDADVQRYYKYDKVLPDIEIKGGGGTNFQPTFSYIEEHNIRPDCLLYFTDGMNFDKPKKPKYPVAWVLMPHCDTRVEWGNKIKLKRGTDDQYT